MSLSVFWNTDFEVMKHPNIPLASIPFEGTIHLQNWIKGNNARNPWQKSLILLRKTKGVPGVPVTSIQFLDISCPNYCQDPTTEVVLQSQSFRWWHPNLCCKMGSREGPLHGLSHGLGFGQ